MANVNTSKNRLYTDEKGKFRKGNPGKPKGTKNYLTLLEEALQKEAEKVGKSFWEKLAEWSFRNPAMAVSILKKFLPDKQHTEHEIAEPIEIVVKHTGKVNEKEGN